MVVTVLAERRRETVMRLRTVLSIAVFVALAACDAGGPPKIGARQPAPPPVQAPPIKPKKPVDTQHELENALITALESQTPRIQGICANAFQRQREIPTNRGIIKDYAGKDAPSFLVKLLEATWEKASKTLIDVMMRYWRERNQRLWAASRDKPKPGRGIGD